MIEMCAKLKQRHNQITTEVIEGFIYYGPHIHNVWLKETDDYINIYISAVILKLMLAQIIETHFLLYSLSNLRICK